MLPWCNSLAAKNMSLEQFTYSNTEIKGEIYSAMKSTDFTGVSVSHSLTLSFFFMIICM